MDTTKNKTPLSLEQVLVSYNIMISFFILFIILMIILMVTNRNGFNKSFGYQIFITGPILLLVAFLIKEIFSFKNNPSSSWFSSFSQSTQSWFMPVLYLFVILLGIFGFFMMLYVGGIFSDKPPENNTAMILNFVIISLFIVIALSVYNSYKNKDDVTLQTLPRAVQEVFKLRTKYTGIFILFSLVITLLYFVNPWNIMTNYGGPVVFFTIFVGMILTIMITIYQYYMSNPTKANMFTNNPGFLGLAGKGLYILAAIGISMGLIYGSLKLMGIFDQDAAKPSSWGHIIFNLILFSAMLGIVYKLANAGGFLDKNPYYRLILNTLFYIPCLLVTLVSYLSKLFGLSKDITVTTAFAPPKPFEIKMLALSLVLLGGYFFWVYLGKYLIETTYLKQGGTQLIDHPVKTNTLTNVISYQNLSGNEKFNYQYAMSFWFYLDSFPPSTNSSYNKIVDILSYGKNPSIKYSSSNNTLYITVKQKTDADSVVDFVQNKEKEIKPETIEKWNSVQDKINDAIEKVKSMPFGNEIDADGNRIIYKHKDVLLQKWNHILLNYNGGTLDVFYNGKLVKSAIEVVPYLKYDMLTVGTENGVSGNIANLMYFKQPLDFYTINTLYASLKHKNPPTILSDK